MAPVGTYSMAFSGGHACRPGTIIWCLLATSGLAFGLDDGLSGQDGGSARPSSARSQEPALGAQPLEQVEGEISCASGCDVFGGKQGLWHFVRSKRARFCRAVAKRSSYAWYSADYCSLILCHEVMYRLFRTRRSGGRSLPARC